MFRTDDLFDLTHTMASGYLSEFEYPWQALKGIENLILMLGKTLDKNEFNEVNKNVWIHKSAVISPTAYIGSPCIIDEKTEVRHCAFIRSSALIGKNCVIGNSTELKNVIIFDEVQIPHYNYIGDSILGYKAHMGAGSITSNVKSDKSHVTIKTDNAKIETGLKKCGAMLGDYVETGCNTVLNPGTIVGKNTNIYPLSCVRGFIKPNSIYKSQGVIVSKF
jgi:NDP-sugar pyrophosphorylase family protein